MDKLDIYVGTLVSFDRVGEKKYNESGTQVLSTTLEFTNIRTIDCVIDEERGNAIDLETGAVHHIIKRDSRGNLLQYEAENIKNASNGTLFVYKYHDKSMKDISLLYQMYIKSRAQKKYQEYLENMKKVESGKVKKIKKNKPTSKIGR